MTSFFERQRAAAGVPASPYSGYHLAHNPFPAVPLLEVSTTEDLRRANACFVRRVREAELNRLLQLVRDAAREPRPANFWVAGERGVGKTSLIVEVWNELRRDDACLPVYIPLPLGGVDVLRSIFDAVAASVGPTAFRNAVYAFIYRRIDVSESLPSGLDPTQLKQQMEQSNFGILDQIFHGSVPAGIERRSFTTFVLDELRRANMGDAVQKAVESALKRDFVEGHLKLRPGPRKQYPESLAGLLRLLVCYYDKVVVFVDQLDTAWTRMTPRDRGNFVSVLSEFVRLAGNAGVLVMALYPELLPVLASEYQEAVRVMPVTERNRIEVPPFTETEQVVEVLVRYLESDSLREERKPQMEVDGLMPLYPFTEAGVARLRETYEGNISRILVQAHDLIERGREADFPLLDEEFIRSALQLPVWEEERPVSDEEMKELI